MAISTYKVFMMQKSGSTYTKLIDIKGFPDLFGEPELLETTTLSDGAQTYIPGIQQIESMDFLFNYTLADFMKIKNLEGTELDLAVWFGGSEAGGVVTPTGENGKFEFKGQVTAYVEGGGVNEVVDAHCVVTPSTVIQQTATV